MHTIAMVFITCICTHAYMYYTANIIILAVSHDHNPTVSMYMQHTILGYILYSYNYIYQ